MLIPTIEEIKCILYLNKVNVLLHGWQMQVGKVSHSGSSSRETVWVNDCRTK